MERPFANAIDAVLNAAKPYDLLTPEVMAFLFTVFTKAVEDIPREHALFVEWDTACERLATERDLSTDHFTLGRSIHLPFEAMNSAESRGWVQKVDAWTWTYRVTTAGLGVLMRGPLTSVARELLDYFRRHPDEPVTRRGAVLALKERHIKCGTKKAQVALDRLEAGEFINRPYGEKSGYYLAVPAGTSEL